MLNLNQEVPNTPKLKIIILFLLGQAVLITGYVTFYYGFMYFVALASGGEVFKELDNFIADLIFFAIPIIIYFLTLATCLFITVVYLNIKGKTAFEIKQNCKYLAICSILLFSLIFLLLAYPY